jgi:hypothetical protein
MSMGFYILPFLQGELGKGREPSQSLIIEALDPATQARISKSTLRKKLIPFIHKISRR